MATSPAILAFPDDGVFPNSRFPVLVYSQALSTPARELAAAFESLFGKNGWGGASWRNGLYQIHHYHSTAHEVLGIFSGRIVLQLGGEAGRQVTVGTGDVVVIPAGVAHKNVSATSDYRVVGAYPDGTAPDLNTGRPGERPDADRNIARVPLPATDPLHGRRGALVEHWARPR